MMGRPLGIFCDTMNGMMGRPFGMFLGNMVAGSWEGTWNMEEKTNKSTKAKIGIMAKLLTMALVPLVALAVLSTVISARIIKLGMEQEAIKRLEDIVSGVNQSLCALGEGDFYLEGETLYRGEENISERVSFFENFADKSDIDITLFYGDTRRVTTLTDHETGERMVGTQAAEHVAQKVLGSGETYVDKKLELNGEAYFCCYIPMQNNDGSIVGMIFAGEPSEGIHQYINREVLKVILLSTLIILLGSILIICFSKTFSSAIQRERDVIEELAQGNLNVTVDPKLRERKDELGNSARALDHLITALSGILRHIQQSADDLMESGKSLDGMAERVNVNAAEISKAVEEISLGAISQSEEIEHASEQITDMGTMIGHMVDGVDKLDATSIAMKESGDSSVEIMKHLTESAQRTNEAVEKIGAQVYATNESAQKIREAVDLISSISSQTSLLSLNASIEAARAGEFGKGFAVVASEIQKLADESSNSAQTITNVIHTLLEESEMTVKVMQEIEGIIADQKDKLKATQSHFIDLSDGINSSREDTAIIEERIKVCDTSRKTVSEVITNLSRISQDNAASAEETTASMEELSATIHLLADEANSLKNLSVQMDETMKFFKM